VSIPKLRLSLEEEAVPSRHSHHNTTKCVVDPRALVDLSRRIAYRHFLLELLESTYIGTYQLVPVLVHVVP
jgi:hypothetical protein